MKNEAFDIYKLGDKLNIPVSATIELNNTCNLKCMHCYIPKHACSGLDFSTLTRVLKELRELGTYEIVLTGGEVFVHPQIRDIIKMIRSLGFHLIIFSNATQIDEDKAKFLADMHIASFSTSIYSLNPKVHDMITSQSGSLRKTLRGLANLKKYGVTVEVKTMLMTPNYKDFPKIVDYCRKNEFACVASPFVFPMSDGNLNPNNLRLSYDQLLEVMPLVDQVIGFEPTKHNDTDFICPSMKHSIGIDCWGNVQACNALFKSFGNVKDKTLRECWNDRQIRKVRNLTYSELPDCKNCQIKSYCVRCAGISCSECGTLTSKYQYACMVARARHAIHTQEGENHEAIC